MAREGSRLGFQGDKASSLGEFIQESPVFCGRDGLSPQLLACLQGSVYVETGKQGWAHSTATHGGKPLSAGVRPIVCCSWLHVCS